MKHYSIRVGTRFVGLLRQHVFMENLCPIIEKDSREIIIVKKQ